MLARLSKTRPLLLGRSFGTGVAIPNTRTTACRGPDASCWLAGPVAPTRAGGGRASDSWLGGSDPSSGCVDLDSRRCDSPSTRAGEWVRQWPEWSSDERAGEELGHGCGGWHGHGVYNAQQMRSGMMEANGSRHGAHIYGSRHDGLLKWVPILGRLLKAIFEPFRIHFRYRVPDGSSVFRHSSLEKITNNMIYNHAAIKLK